MNIPAIVALLGGVALFLYGMCIMSDGLKKVAGNRLEVILYRLTSNPAKGFMLGAGVTAVIQSSCATSIMVVGFVNSGMMKLRQAISIILGAILGTSITGWIVCLSYIDSAGISAILSTAVLTGIVAVVGIVYRMFLKGHFRHRIGDILMGFAILMFGMSAMSSAVSEMRALFGDIIASLSDPLFGILIGIVFTAILQSASAAVGVLQALSVAGGMTLSAAFPILLGIGIGAGVPVLFSALRADTEGKRTAAVYPVSEIISVILIGGGFYLLNTIFGFAALTGTQMDPFSLAMLNTLLRLVKMIILLPFTSLIERIVTGLIKDKTREKKSPAQTVHLEERFIAYPALAIEQSRTAINQMAASATKSIFSAIDLICRYSPEGFRKVQSLEELGDQYEDSLGTYLVKLTAGFLTDNQNKDVSKFLHTISDFERISDHALNIAEVSQEIFEKGVTFSEEARHEIDVLTAAVTDIVSTAIHAFVHNDLSLAHRVEPLEEIIDDLCDEMKLHHINRIKNGQCTLHQGFVFTDLLTNFERISDHCSNIAVALIELESEQFDTHQYLDSLKKAESPTFDTYFKEYASQYHI